MRGGGKALRFSRRRLLKIAFVVLALATTLLAARFFWRLAHFSLHAGEPPQGWMPIGYIARLHGVPVEILKSALGLPIDAVDRRPISEIAAERGLTEEAFIGQIMAEIEKLKQAAK